MKAYKLFKIKNGKLFPLYIHTKEETPIGVDIKAKVGEIKKNGKVKSKLGDLAYRPGWHCCEVPLADHIGTRQPDGRLFQAIDSVWCEIEVSDAVDYTEVAKSKSKNTRDQYLKEIPENGFYWYQTNTKARIRWLICGSIKVLRILGQDEVNKICRDHGVEPQPVSEI